MATDNIPSPLFTVTQAPVFSNSANFCERIISLDVTECEKMRECESSGMQRQGTRGSREGGERKKEKRDRKRENTLKLRLVSRGSLGDLKVRDEGIERMQKRKGIDSVRGKENAVTARFEAA